MKIGFDVISFPAAHYIPDQGGKCEGIHGHNYVVKDLVIDFYGRVTIDEIGMIVDFGVIKEYFKEEWDHKFIVPEYDADMWTSLIEKKGMPHNLVVLKYTTAELMAKRMQEDLKDIIKKHTNADFSVSFKLYEGANQYVEV